MAEEEPARKRARIEEEHEEEEELESDESMDIDSSQVLLSPAPSQDIRRATEELIASRVGNVLNVHVFTSISLSLLL